jgi:DNA-binding PucR family transcriptional regulator
MIDGRSTSEDLRLQAGSFPVGASEIYLVMVLRGFPDHAVGALRSAARRLADGRLVRASVAHVRDDDLISILALARDDPSAASERVATEMAATAGKLGCAPALGIGLRSCGPEQVDESYREARAAAAAAGPGGQLSLAKLSLASRLTLMLASGAVPERLIPDRVRAFIDEDRDGHGQLIETLREYAACDLNARRAATALFVHRNTVLYRLQRVEELSGLDPHSLPQLVDLMAAVRLTEGAQATAAAIARPATRPESRQPPRNVPSSAR